MVSVYESYLWWNIRILYVQKSVGDHISDSYSSSTLIFHIIFKESRYYSAERYNTLFYRDYSAGNIHSTDG